MSTGTEHGKGPDGRGPDVDRKLVSVTINGTEVDVPKKTTGRALRLAGRVPANETLYRTGDKHGDEQIGDDDQVQARDGDVFESGPDGSVS